MRVWIRPRQAWMGLEVALLTLLTLAVALGGCGASSHAGAGRGSTPGGATTGVIPGGAMAVRPCPGQAGSAAADGALALTLTETNSAGSAHVGDLIQAQLPATTHWTLTGQPGNLTTLTAGGQDSALNICYWTFRAQAAGSATLRFSGAQPCDPPAIPCTGATTEQDFTVTVS